MKKLYYLYYNEIYFTSFYSDNDDSAKRFGAMLLRLSAVTYDENLMRVMPVE